MTFHALVVDTDPEILNIAKERIESHGHTCDLARSQAEAKELLNDNRYSYVLLDLNIPIKSGCTSKVTNGQDLLWTIRRDKRSKDIPIINMVPEERDSICFAFKVMRNGGTIYSMLKPFSDHGHFLGKLIREALGKSQGEKSHRNPLQPPRCFERGELTFYPSRVELCGVKVCGSEGSSIARRILDTLRGNRSLGGDELAGLVGVEDGQAVASAVRNFRKRVERAMLKEANMTIDPGIDVLINDRIHGYRFSDKVYLTDGQKPVADRGPVKDFPIWLLSELKRSGRIQRKQISQHTGFSKSMIRRNLAQLREKGQIVFEGSSRNGYWRLV